MNKKQLSSKLLILLTAAASLFSMEAAMLSEVALATPKDDAILLAEGTDYSRTMYLFCSPHHITIRSIGSDSREEYSYESEDLHITNGVRDGETYTFHQNDFEYRVDIVRDGDLAYIKVFHYSSLISEPTCYWAY